jgi:hypothetical protein
MIHVFIKATLAVIEAKYGEFYRRMSGSIGPIRGVLVPNREERRNQ